MTKGGSLNEYGLAAYKVADEFAQRELDWLLRLGGIRLTTGWKHEHAVQLQTLRDRHDAVYLAVGLATTLGLGVPGDELMGVRDAVAFIADLRQAGGPAQWQQWQKMQQLQQLPAGR